ncbi:MAG: MOSC domain-containing protein [Casimicrobiaceae bacterium]
MTAPTIDALHVYPVKGCRGLSPERVVAEVTGFANNGLGDREWMVIDSQARFVTQREFPRLALVEVSLAGDRLALTTPQLSPLRLPLASNPCPAREVRVWRSAVRGFDEGDRAANWLSRALGAPVRLVRFDRTKPRRCNSDYVGATGAQTLFADGYPVLVIGLASLTDLNARLEANGFPEVPMNRFRPNLVLAGLDPYAEDYIDTIEAGGVVLQCVKPCTRCQVTTTDQATGHVGVEPLRTLSGYRMNERFGGVTFGMNAIVVAGAGGTLTRGDDARVAFRF